MLTLRHSPRFFLIIENVIFAMVGKKSKPSQTTAFPSFLLQSTFVSLLLCLLSFLRPRQPHKAQVSQACANQVYQLPCNSPSMQWKKATAWPSPSLLLPGTKAVSERDQQIHTVSLTDTLRQQSSVL